MTTYNIYTYFGVSGLAIKATNFIAYSLRHYNAKVGGLTIRYSPYAPCYDGVISDVICEPVVSTPGGVGGINILNDEQGAELRNVSINNVLCVGTVVGENIYNGGNSTQSKSINISNLIVKSTTGFSVSIHGNVASSSISNATIDNCGAFIGTFYDQPTDSSPSDLYITNTNYIHGPKSLNTAYNITGTRIAIDGFKTNDLGMNSLNPIVTNNGDDTYISNITYNGISIIDINNGYHKSGGIETLRGHSIGAGTEGTAVASRFFDGSQQVTIRNLIVTNAVTDISIPPFMAFKTASTSIPAQIRQNYSGTASGYLNATTPTVTGINFITLVPISSTTVRVFVNTASGMPVDGVVLSINLIGDFRSLFTASLTMAHVHDATNGLAKNFLIMITRRYFFYF